MNCLGSLGVDSFEKIRSNLFLREQRKPDVEAFLSIIVSCLKYKLFIVFYLEGESIFPYDSDDANQNKTTQVFYFDHVVSKVKRLSYQGLRRVRNLDHFIYNIYQEKWKQQPHIPLLDQGIELFVPKQDRILLQSPQI